MQSFTTCSIKLLHSSSKIVSAKKDTFDAVYIVCYKSTGTVKPVLSGHSKRRPKFVFKAKYRLKQVKSIAECSKRAFCIILSTFSKLPFVLKTFVLSIFE